MKNNKINLFIKQNYSTILKITNNIRILVGILCILLVNIFLIFFDLHIESYILFQEISNLSAAIYLTIYISLISLIPLNAAAAIPEQNSYIKNNKYLRLFIKILYNTVILSPLGLLYIMFKTYKSIFFAKHATIILKAGFLVIKKKYNEYNLDEAVSIINNEYLNLLLDNRTNKNILLNRVKEDKSPFENQGEIIKDFYLEALSIYKEWLASQPGFIENIFNSIYNFFSAHPKFSITALFIISSLILSSSSYSSVNASSEEEYKLSDHEIALLLSEQEDLDFSSSSMAMPNDDIPLPNFDARISSMAMPNDSSSSSSSSSDVDPRYLLPNFGIEEMDNDLL